MSPNKTLYVRDGDADIWEKAERHAETTGLSVSFIVANALRRYLSPDTPPPSDEGMERIEVEVGDEGLAVKQAFTGRWLVDPDKSVALDRDGWGWGIALTKRGRIAVFVVARDRDLPSNSLHVYDSLAEVNGTGVPEGILDQAAAALGQDWVINLDI